MLLQRRRVHALAINCTCIPPPDTRCKPWASSASKRITLALASHQTLMHSLYAVGWPVSEVYVFKSSQRVAALRLRRHLHPRCLSIDVEPVTGAHHVRSVQRIGRVGEQLVPPLRQTLERHRRLIPGALLFHSPRHNGRRVRLIVSGRRGEDAQDVVSDEKRSHDDRR